MKRIEDKTNKKTTNNMSMLDMFYLSKTNISKTNQFYDKNKIKDIEK